jgi:hypothetical protein
MTLRPRCPSTSRAAQYSVDCVLVEHVAVRGAGVLTTPIRMMDEPWRRSSTGQRHLQCCGCQLSPQVIS